jgi:hypothetical protein
MDLLKTLERSLSALDAARQNHQRYCSGFPAEYLFVDRAGAQARDMGSHLCALPTGEHCPKGLICLGCAHAQPKKSVVPIFRRMLASHERSLVAARGHSEPAGQIAAREMEIVRIKGALQRAEELSDDVAVAIEQAL